MYNRVLVVVLQLPPIATMFDMTTSFLKRLWQYASGERRCHLWMFVCIENEVQRSLTPASGQLQEGGVLVCFSVISLGGKGHRDVKRRFSLRAEIKPHTCDRLGSCPDVWLCWFPSDCRSSTSIKQLMQNIYITLWPNNTARLFIKLPDSKHHFKSKCWLSAGLNVTRFTRRYRYLIALGAAVQREERGCGTTVLPLGGSECGEDGGVKAVRFVSCVLRDTKTQQSNPGWLLPASFISPG